MIFQSPRPKVDIPRVAVTTYVFEHADETADRTAMVDAITDRRMTYAGLQATIARASAGLAARGYGRGDVFGIYAPNTLEYPIAFHGAAQLGAVITTVNPLFTADEIAKQLRDCGAQVPLHDSGLHGEGAPGGGAAPACARSSSSARRRERSPSPSVIAASGAPPTGAVDLDTWWPCPTRAGPPACPRA